MNKLFVVGLTGPTGAGKSEVAAVLAERGCAVIDADVLARRAVLPGSPCLQALTAHFSKDILLPDGTLDRKALAAAAFASPEQTRVLNSIVHPQVIAMTQALLADAKQRGVPMAVIDAPLLFQAGLGAICHCTVAVLAPRELRSQRICARDGITPQQAELRMNAQPSDEYYEQRATVVIRNIGDRAALRATARTLLDQLEEWCHEREP